MKPMTLRNIVVGTIIGVVWSGFAHLIHAPLWASVLLAVPFGFVCALIIP